MAEVSVRESCRCCYPKEGGKGLCVYCSDHCLNMVPHSGPRERDAPPNDSPYWAYMAKGA